MVRKTAPKWILEMTDVDTLHRWYRAAMVVQSAEDLFLRT